MKERKLNNEGFSLIELIVVIAIMAILVGVMAPTVTKFIERANESNDIQALQTIYTAVYTSKMDPMITENVPTNSYTLTAPTAGALDNDFNKSVCEILGTTDFSSIVFKSEKAGKTGSTVPNATNVTITLSGNDVTVVLGHLKVDKNGADSNYTAPTT